MAKELDVIKLCESLIDGNSVKYENGKYERGDLARRLISALKEQGLAVDENNKIFRINPEPKPHDGDLEPTAPIKMSAQPSFEESQGEQPTVVLYGLTNCTSEEKSELTEFEDALACAFCEVKTWKDDGNDNPVKEYAKVITERLLPIARKQIASEIFEDVMVDKKFGKVLPPIEAQDGFLLSRARYREGIEDTKKLIEEGE